MKNILKKITICGTSLLMVVSLSVDINNVSAKKVNHHTHTSKINTNHHYLFNQGHNDGKQYGRNFDIGLPSTSQKYFSNTYNNVILHLIENHYNKSYQHGFTKGMSDIVGGHLPSAFQNIGFLTHRTKKLARHHHLNSHNVYAYFHKDTHKHSSKHNHKRYNIKRHNTKKHSKK